MLQHQLRPVCLPLLLAAGSFLGAQDFQSSQAGFQGILTFPQNDLRHVSSASLGFQAGLHLTVPVVPGQDLRPRIDYQRYDGGGVAGLALRDTVYAFDLGADYLYYFQGRRRGTYLVGGLAWVWWKVDNRGQTPSYTQAPRLTAGVGYWINPRFSLEVTLSDGHFKPAPGDAFTFGLGGIFRF